MAMLRCAMRRQDKTDCLIEFFYDREKTTVDREDADASALCLFARGRMRPSARLPHRAYTWSFTDSFVRPRR